MRYSENFQGLFSCQTQDSGLGFGLSIVAGLAEDLGGRITFERIPSGGLSVFVRLPLAKEKS